MSRTTLLDSERSGKVMELRPLLKEESEGRSEEFEKLVLAHLNLLYSVALQFTRNRTDAEDLVQNTVLKALRFHRKFKEGTYIKAWLMTILRNTYINEYRRVARRPTPVQLTGVESASPSYSPDPLVRGETSAPDPGDTVELLEEEVRQAVDSLPKGFREAVLMADIKDRSYKEIADTLGCPLGTVMSRIHRGRKLLREQLREYARNRGLAGSS